MEKVNKTIETKRCKSKTKSMLTSFFCLFGELPFATNENPVFVQQQILSTVFVAQRERVK